MMLKENTPTAFAALYQTTSEARLYSILPPIQEVIPAGEIFSVRITLYGRATEYAMAVTNAIVELGKSGLRPGGKFDLYTAKTMTNGTEIEYCNESDGFIQLPQISHIASLLAMPQTVKHSCKVIFTTPLRIKEGNDLLRNLPTYAQLIRRALGRVDQLAHVTGSDTPIAKEARSTLYDEADSVTVVNAEKKDFRVIRRSARSGDQMQYEGLLGFAEYSGTIATTLPLLRLTEQIQLGGKTSFGFGGIKVEN